LWHGVYGHDQTTRSCIFKRENRDARSRTSAAAGRSGRNSRRSRGIAAPTCLVSMIRQNRDLPPSQRSGRNRARHRQRRRMERPSPCNVIVGPFGSALVDSQWSGCRAAREIGAGGAPAGLATRFLGAMIAALSAAASASASIGSSVGVGDDVESHSRIARTRHRLQRAFAGAAFCSSRSCDSCKGCDTDKQARVLLAGEGEVHPAVIVLMIFRLAVTLTSLWGVWTVLIALPAATSGMSPGVQHSS
jgi:hypothetical protein